MSRVRSRGPDKDGELPELSTRQRDVVHQAARLFDECGYHQTSMDDIAEAVGLGKPTLYHHFSSKGEILFWIHHEFIEPLIELDRRRRRLAPLERLRWLLRDCLRSVHLHKSYARVFLEHLREIPDDLRVRAIERRDLYTSFVEEAITDGISCGSLRDVDPKLATLSFLGMVNWSYQWYRPDGRYSHEEIADTMFTFMMGALAAPGAHDVDRPSAGVARVRR